MRWHSTAPGIENRKLKSPSPFSLWFKPVFSASPPTSSLGEPFARARSNYLSILSWASSCLPTSLLLSSLYEEPSCPQCPSHSCLAACRIPAHVSRVMPSAHPPQSLCPIIPIRNCLSLSVCVVNNHCPPVAQTMFCLLLFLLIGHDYLLLRLETPCGKGIVTSCL